MTAAQRHALLAGAVACALATGCAKRLGVMPGVAPAVATLPAIGLPPAYTKVTFKWELNGDALVARGEGVARLAAPDSARVDLFLAGGFGAAAAILTRDSLTVPPGGGAVLGMIPPPPLLWASLGRLALPALRDTVVRVSGDTLRATIGTPVEWRITVVGSELVRVERVAGDRIVEWVDRVPGKSVHYELSGRRSLVLDIENSQPAIPYDASIWRF